MLTLLLPGIGAISRAEVREVHMEMGSSGRRLGSQTTSMWAAAFAGTCPLCQVKTNQRLESRKIDES